MPFEMNEDLSEYGDVSDLLGRARLAPDDLEHLTREQLLHQLTRFAEAGWEDAALELGHQLSAPGPNRNPEPAYRWFHIGFCWSG